MEYPSGYSNGYDRHYAHWLYRETSCISLLLFWKVSVVRIFNGWLIDIITINPVKQTSFVGRINATSPIIGWGDQSHYICYRYLHKTLIHNFDGTFANTTDIKNRILQAFKVPKPVGHFPDIATCCSFMWLWGVLPGRFKVPPAAIIYSLWLCQCCKFSYFNFRIYFSPYWDPRVCRTSHQEPIVSSLEVVEKMPPIP